MAKALKVFKEDALLKTSRTKVWALVLAWALGATYLGRLTLNYGCKSQLKNVDFRQSQNAV